MNVTKIKIQHFKSIYDELIIDFDDIKGFWKIEGDVGTGKTTIGEAIIFGLFGSITGKTNDSLISWGSKHALVELWCICKGHTLYIKREINKYGQSPIYVEVDNEELIFTNKRNAQQQLEQEYYDISKNTIELLCIISFNNFKSLATLNTSDTKKFLDHMLGFEILTKYADTCKIFKKESEDNCIETSNKISNNNAQIDKIIELSTQTKISGNIAEKQRKIESIEDSLKSYNQETESKLSSLRNSLTAQQESLVKIKILGANKKKEIDFIKKGKCPTCGAPIDQSQLSLKEQEREILLTQYKEINNKIKSIETDIISYKQNRKNNSESLRAQLIEEHKILSTLKEQEKRANIDIHAIDDLKEDNRQLQDQLNNISSETIQWEELQEILTDEVRIKILSSFIPILNKNILKYTQQLRIPYIITFDTGFKCTISICGVDESIPLSSLSTGQMKTVDMCIILGVLNTIVSCVSFNILFLDELISNAHKELRDDICYVLKQNIKQNNTIFLITHADVEQKYFDGEINTRLQYIDEVHKKSVYNINHFNKEQLN